MTFDREFILYVSLASVKWDPEKLLYD